METKARDREKDFAPGTSRNREGGVTFRVAVAKDAIQLLEMGERIKKLRVDHGLRQQTIADYCGVQLRTYQFWQQGKHPPDQDSLQKLAELFGVTATYILRGPTPDLSNGDGDVAERLERLESSIVALDQKLSRLLPDPDSPAEPASIDELADYARALLRAMDQITGRLGRDLGKRDLQERAVRGRPSGSREDVA